MEIANKISYILLNEKFIFKKTLSNKKKSNLQEQTSIQFEEIGFINENTFKLLYSNLLLFKLKKIPYSINFIY